jgi:hypothetical protein
MNSSKFLIITKDKPMIKKLITTFSLIALITSGMAGDVPTSTIDLSKEYSVKDKQILGNILVSIQPYLTQEERNILSDLIKKGVTRQVMDLGKNTQKKAK